ncbi:hypothetical protein BDV40DRAFT_256047 [Aspergillus tamarii]|uniref:Uncharacterized protein n=1 Tax=Aspergillus tamarii TaxID=41984 RepID=A0A5N6V5B7_ASPTM|nr:hypothetical protein BDV40DRAFT_256047 [Aspergillus tamarii]
MSRQLACPHIIHYVCGVSSTIINLTTKSWLLLFSSFLLQIIENIIFRLIAQTSIVGYTQC